MNKATYISQLIGLIFLFMLTFSSCARIELLEKGSVTLIADWTAVDQSLDIPASYTVKINNQLLPFTAASNTLPDLYPARYPVLAYNQPAQVKILGSKAVVSQENGLLAILPGWLFTVFGEVAYENNKISSYTLKMVQQIRQLRIKLSPPGGAASNIEHI